MSSPTHDSDPLAGGRNGEALPRRKLSDDDIKNLLQRIGRGDKDAFLDFYVNFQRDMEKIVGAAMYKASLPSVLGAKTVDDILSDVWLRVWTNAGLYQDKGSVRQWLSTLARNIVFDAGREYWRKREISIEDVQEEEPENSHLPYKALKEALKHEFDFVEYCDFCIFWESLNTEEKKVLGLLGRGYSVDEVARKMGVSRTTIYTLRKRARAIAKRRGFE
jgi:RNA polymerase sigma-70 factor (ECF subfamily)